MPKTNRPSPRLSPSAAPTLPALGRHPLLTAESERELARKARAGDAAARDELILANVRLVLSLAKVYRDRGLPYPDLVGHGLLGLIRAADKFDPGRDVKFSTYSSYWIRQAIGRACEEAASPVHVPAWAAQAVRSGRVELTSSRRPRAEECRAARVAAARAVLAAEWSVFEAVRVLDRPVEPASWDAEDAAAGAADVRRLLATLDRRARAVVRRRFGLGGRPPETLRQIGADLGLSAEGVRLIERDALATMRAKAGEGVARAV